MALIRLQEDDDAEGLFGDLRLRVIETVRAGASRREAAEVFSLAVGTAVKCSSISAVRPAECDDAGWAKFSPPAAARPDAGSFAPAPNRRARPRLG